MKKVIKHSNIEAATNFSHTDLMDEMCDILGKFLRQRGDYIGDNDQWLDIIDAAAEKAWEEYINED